VSSTLIQHFWKSIAISSVLVENKALLAQTLGMYAITALIVYAVTYFYISKKE